MRRVDFQGIPLCLEVEPGGVRKFDDGTTSMPYKYAYGYIEETISTEPGEEQDVLLGPFPDATLAFILPIMKREDPAALDEHKLLLGFEDPREAQRAAMDTWGWCCNTGELLVTTTADVKREVESQVIKFRKEEEPREVEKEALMLPMDEVTEEPVLELLS